MLGHSIVSQHFMEPEGSIPNSQELSTCSSSEPDQSLALQNLKFSINTKTSPWQTWKWISNPVFSVPLVYISCALCYFDVHSWFLKKKTPWSESKSELYRPSDRRLSAKWLPTFADRGCHVISVTDPYGRILGFIDKTGAATLLSSSSSVVLTRLSGPRSRPTTFFSGSAGNRTRASGSVTKNSDH
jgi:hypothetical protein